MIEDELNQPRQMNNKLQEQVNLQKKLIEKQQEHIDLLEQQNRLQEQQITRLMEEAKAWQEWLDTSNSKRHQSPSSQQFMSPPRDRHQPKGKTPGEVQGHRTDRQNTALGEGVPKVVKQGEGSRLLGTMRAKILTAVLVIVIVATGAAATVIATRGALHPAPAYQAPTSTLQTPNTPTAIPTQTNTPASTTQPLAGSVTVFPLPNLGNEPQNITLGPDGNLWFTECIPTLNSSGGTVCNGRIGRITPGGQITEFPIPTPQSSPGGIAAGPGGNLWFTEVIGNQIGRVTPRGQITEFPLPTAGSAPAGITVGPDGNLWFTEIDRNTIGRITPFGSIQEFPLPSCATPTQPTHGCFPGWITRGPDGTLWFTEGDSKQIGGHNIFSIGRITLEGQITLFPTQLVRGAAELTAGPDGNLWFTESLGTQIGQITPSGQITVFPLPPLPNLGNEPQSITLGPDGNLWFTEQLSNQIGRITPSGQITVFSLPTRGSGPIEITTGPSGTLWFTEQSGIGRIIFGK